MTVMVGMPTNVWWDSVSSMRLLRAGTSMRSRYTGRRQSVVFPFAIWTFEGQTIKLDGTDAGEWRGFLAQLNGPKNVFRLVVPGTDGGPLSGFSGLASVGTAGAAAGATSMPVTTSGVGATFLKRGDYFTINDELKLCTADCAAGTDVSLHFEPFLRSAVTAGMTVYFTDPWALMCAADFDVADWSLEHPVQHTVKLKCVEALSVDGTGALLLESDTAGTDALLLE